MDLEQNKEVADKRADCSNPIKDPTLLTEQIEEEATNLYERKCILVNREIDRMSMGRYQWHLWGLCGFGYMIDLPWAQVFGLALSPMQQELGFRDDQTGNLSTAFSSGLTAGMLGIDDNLRWTHW